MMEGFTRTEIKTSGASIVTVHGGKGPPLLLIHGNPFTHLSWHKFAPRLAQEFTVVATDLRGYGDSSKPPGGERQVNYSFRAMAHDSVEVMAELGHKTFMAAGHDRGARVLHRMCLDHPEKVQRAAILDIIPQHHLFNHINKKLGDVLLSLVLQHPAGADAREDDGRRSRLVHREEAREDPAGPELLRQGGAGGIQALLPQSGDHPRHLRGLSRDCAGIDLEMDTEDFDAGKQDHLPVADPVGRDRQRRPQQQASRRRSGRTTPPTSAAPRRCPAGITCRRRRRRKLIRRCGSSFLAK